MSWGEDYVHDLLKAMSNLTHSTGMSLPYGHYERYHSYLEVTFQGEKGILSCVPSSHFSFWQRL